MAAAVPNPSIILVVDDQPDVRRLTCQTLECEGYQALEADGGREALTLLASHADSIALVLSDVRMPEMSGLALEQAIADQWPRLPVILMSGEVTRERMLGQNHRSALRKPFTREELLEMVREALSQR